MLKVNISREDRIDEIVYNCISCRNAIYIWSTDSTDNAYVEDFYEYDKLLGVLYDED